MSLADEENVQPLLSPQSVETGEPITQEEAAKMGETTEEETREPRVDPDNPDLNPDLDPDVDPDADPNLNPDLTPEVPAPEEPATEE